jgi:CheY-like chemotaxis protein
LLLRKKLLYLKFQPKGETILVVKDRSALLNMSTRLLESLKYNVICASSASEALGLAEKHAGKFHLLLTDVVMPDIPPT